MERERVLVGIDDERASAVALDWAILRARRRLADLTLMSVFELFLADPTADEEHLERSAVRVRRELPNTPVETVFLESTIVDAVVAASGSYDLLVIGSHAHHPVRSAIGGSIPYRLAARAACPTVVVPDDWADQSGPIVVGVADDDTADAALDFAADEAVATGVELVLVHAWQLPTPGDEITAMLVDPDELLAAHQDILSAAAARVRERQPNLRIREVLQLGRAVDVLEPEMLRGSMVVLGTHHRGPLGALMLGSSVRDCLRSGRVPVCVVPLTADESEGS